MLGHSHRQRDSSGSVIEDSPAPRESCYCRRLRHPMHRLAALIGCVEQNHAMGIGPYELRDGPLEIDLFRGVVGRITVVRGERKRKSRKTDQQSEGD